MKKLLLLISFMAIQASAGEVDYYQNNVTPGYELWEYIDNCGVSHKLRIKKENSTEEKVSKWFEDIIKLTEAHKC